jgi:hypothetical protein
MAVDGVGFLLIIEEGNGEKKQSSLKLHEIGDEERSRGVGCRRFDCGFGLLGRLLARGCVLGVAAGRCRGARLVRGSRCRAGWARTARAVRRASASGPPGHGSSTDVREERGREERE